MSYYALWCRLTFTMSQGFTEFSVSWLTHGDANVQCLRGWYRRGHDDFHAYCRLCDIEMKCDHAG